MTDPQPLAGDELATIRSRYWSWHGADNDTPGGAQFWPGGDPDESMSHYIVRNDVPWLVAEIERLRGDNEQGRVNLAHYRETYDALAGENARLHEQRTDLLEFVASLEKTGDAIRGHEIRDALRSP